MDILLRTTALDRPRLGVAPPTQRGARSTVFILDGCREPDGNSGFAKHRCGILSARHGNRISVLEERTAEPRGNTPASRTRGELGTAYRTTLVQAMGCGSGHWLYRLSAATGCHWPATGATAGPGDGACSPLVVWMVRCYASASATHICANDVATAMSSVEWYAATLEEQY